MTIWGEATSDEMCFAFIFLTPERPEFSFVLQYGSVDTCSSALTSYGGCPPMELGFVANTRCHMTSFVQRERKLIMDDVNENCKEIDGCTCVEPLKLYKEHPCINTTDLSIPRYIKSEHPLLDEEEARLTKMIQMCKSKLEPPLPPSRSSACCKSSFYVYQCLIAAIYLVALVAH